MAEAQLNYAFGQTDTLLEALAQPPGSAGEDRTRKVCVNSTLWAVYSYIVKSDSKGNHSGRPPFHFVPGFRFLMCFWFPDWG